MRQDIDGLIAHTDYGLHLLAALIPIFALLAAYVGNGTSSPDWCIPVAINALWQLRKARIIRERWEPYSVRA